MKKLVERYCRLVEQYELHFYNIEKKVYFFLFSYHEFFLHVDIDEHIWRKYSWFFYLKYYMDKLRLYFGSMKSNTQFFPSRLRGMGSLFSIVIYQSLRTGFNVTHQED